jgi:hypothetical protein
MAVEARGVTGREKGQGMLELQTPATCDGAPGGRNSGSNHGTRMLAIGERAKKAAQESDGILQKGHSIFTRLRILTPHASLGQRMTS